MSHVHIDFPDKNNNFLEKPAITQKLNMVHLYIMQSLKWKNILCCLRQVVHYGYEIEKKKSYMQIIFLVTSRKSCVFTYNFFKIIALS